MEVPPWSTGKVYVQQLPSVSIRLFDSNEVVAIDTEMSSTHWQPFQAVMKQEWRRAKEVGGGSRLFGGIAKMATQC